MAVSPAALAEEVEADLDRTLNAWFPLCIDETDGGFHEAFDRRWSKQAASPRTLVYQARITWVLAAVAGRRTETSAPYAGWARHGLAYLESSFLDPVNGGLYFHATDTSEKHSYGIAFGVFAAAGCSRHAGIAGADEFAMQLFRWWSQLAYDERQQGYCDALTADGSPKRVGSRPKDLISVPYGHRSMNTHLHAIEALTELYRATREPEVEARLQALVRRLESLVERHGRLYTTYTYDWQPADRTISFGHDIEAIFLALDARDSLGWRGDSPVSRLLARTLTKGIDRRHGGMIYGRRRFRPLLDKVDWVQAEALNCLGYLACFDDRARSAHLQAFAGVWRFVSDHMIDHEHGGWFTRLDRVGQVLDDRKAHRWKACYHPVRALLNSLDHLTALS